MKKEIYLTLIPISSGKSYFSHSNCVVLVKVIVSYDPGILVIINFNWNECLNQLGSLEACLGGLDLGKESHVSILWLAVRWCAAADIFCFTNQLCQGNQESCMGIGEWGQKERDRGGWPGNREFGNSPVSCFWCLRGHLMLSWLHIYSKITSNLPKSMSYIF